MQEGGAQMPLAKRSPSSRGDDLLAAGRRLAAACSLLAGAGCTTPAPADTAGHMRVLHVLATDRAPQSAPQLAATAGLTLALPANSLQRMPRCTQKGLLAHLPARHDGATASAPREK
jgi:hypothetical protein